MCKASIVILLCKATLLRAIMSCYQVNPAKWKLKVNVKYSQKTKKIPSLCTWNTWNAEFGNISKTSENYSKTMDLSKYKHIHFQMLHIFDEDQFCVW